MRERESDAQLVARVRAGEIQAFGPLVQRYTPLVTRMAVSQRIPEDERDAVVQEAMVRAFGSLERFDDSRRFDLWLSGIAFRTCKEYWRRHGRRKSVPFSQLAKTDRAEVSRKAAWQQDQPSERAERAERRRKLLEALSCLNADQRFAVTAYYFEERSIAEICEAAGWSRSKVKVTLHRARTKLAKLLAQALEEDHA